MWLSAVSPLSVPLPLLCSARVKGCGQDADEAGESCHCLNFNPDAEILTQTCAGAGSVLLGLYGTANVTYAGGKNSTFFNGVGTNANVPATVNYFNSGAHRVQESNIPSAAFSCR